MRIITGRRKVPPRVIIFGRHSVGKTTWAAQAPAALILATERGADGIGCDRTDVFDTLDSLVRGIGEAATLPQYETLVLDSLSECARLVREATKAANKLSDMEYEAYGKGVNASAVQWDRLRAALEDANRAGKAIVCVAHAQTRTIKNPSGTDYVAHEMALPDAASASFARWADDVLFATFATSVNDKDHKMETTGERYVLTTIGDGFYAKNRCNLPPRIPLDWHAYQSARDAYYANAPDAKAEAAAALALVPEEHPKREAMAAAFAVCKSDSEFASFARRVAASLKAS